MRNIKPPSSFSFIGQPEFHEFIDEVFYDEFEEFLDVLEEHGGPITEERMEAGLEMIFRAGYALAVSHAREAEYQKSLCLSAMEDAMWDEDLAQLERMEE